MKKTIAQYGLDSVYGIRESERAEMEGGNYHVCSDSTEDFHPSS